jgi:hypothetical protein
MKCNKVRRLLPLSAGGDLKTGQAMKVEDHIRNCPECRREYEAYRSSLEKTRIVLREECRDWSEEEWRRVVGKAVVSRSAPSPVMAPWPFRQVWAYVLMAVLAVSAAWLAVKPSAFARYFQMESAVVAQLRQEPFWDEGKKAAQDVIRMTMVSRESGLKIVWLLDKNFKWENDE